MKRRAFLLALAPVLLAVSPAGPAAAAEPVFACSIWMAGSTAMFVAVELSEATQLTLDYRIRDSLTLSHDSSAYYYLFNMDTGELWFEYRSMASSSFYEVAASVGPLQLDQGPGDPRPNGAWVAGPEPLPAGRWGFVMMPGTTGSIDNVSFVLEAPVPPSSVLVSSAPSHFITPRDYPSQVYARVLRAGASWSQGDYPFSVAHRLFGFSYYDPTPAGVDVTAYALRTPGGSLDAEDLSMRDWAAGDYAWSLEQLTAGEWAARAFALWADLPTPTSPACP